MLCPLRLVIEDLEIGSPTLLDAAMLKRHCRVDTADDDDLIDLYLQVAIRWAEAATHRTILQRSHSWVLRDFGTSRYQEIRLPCGKATSVESIEYSLNGATTVLYGPTGDTSPPGSDYQEDLRSDSGGVLMPPRASSWPTPDSDVPAPVTINFTAGYLGDDIPSDIKHALMFFVADCYDLRGTPDFNPSLLDTSGVRFDAREKLISAWRLPRIY